MSIPKPTKWTVLSVFPVSPFQLKDRDRTLRLSWLFAMSDNDRPRRGLRRIRALLATLTSAVDDVIADACHRSAKKQKKSQRAAEKGAVWRRKIKHRPVEKRCLLYSGKGRYCPQNEDTVSVSFVAGSVGLLFEISDAPSLLLLRLRLRRRHHLLGSACGCAASSCGSQ